MYYGIRITENYFRRTHVIFVINGIKLFNQIMLMDFNNDNALVGINIIRPRQNLPTWLILKPWCVIQNQNEISYYTYKFIIFNNMLKY